MIYVVAGSHPLPYEATGSITLSTVPEFLKWFSQQREYQLDVETTVTDWWCNKKLITTQFGSIDGKTQWVIQWSKLNNLGKAKIKEILEDSSKLKLIHNALFEYVVLRFHGIIIENVYDTMLAEQIILGGEQPLKGQSFYSLDALHIKYLGSELDKSMQTEFGDDILTWEKVKYAATDVVPLGFIRKMQIDVLKNTGSEATAALEMEAVLGFGDMTYYGMELNVEDWMANLSQVQPLVEEARNKLNETLLNDPVLGPKAIALGHLSLEDRFLFNWNSPTQKAEVLSWLVPEIKGSSKAVLGKWLRENKEHTYAKAITEYLDGNINLLEHYILSLFRNRLIENGWLIPSGQLTINWNSQPQVLPLLKAIQPKLKAMDDASFKKFGNHPIFALISDYKDTLKLETTYGASWIEQYVEPDGKVRTRFNQIVTTGRISSSKPNMQNIPAKDSVGNRYRNAFTCASNQKYVDGDYSSQELNVIAFLSKDPVWLDALEKGQDLHSVCSEVLYGMKWARAAEEGCKYYAKGPDGQQLKQKCNCKGHKKLRGGVKNLDFGLAYGMSEMKLANDLGISVPEAKALMDLYFSKFPNIKYLLDYLGNFGVRNGFIQTIAPFFRKRYFDEWHKVTEEIRHMYLAGIDSDYRLGRIDRQSRNQPIQGSSADMTKLAVVFIRWEIRNNGLWDTIHLVAQVHDQITTLAITEYAEVWKNRMQELMEQAALFVIPNGLLKADVNITDRWSK